jgi:hypothetical protein
MFRFAALLALALAFSLGRPDPAVATVVPGTPSAEVDIAGVVGRWDRARAQDDRRVLDQVMASDFSASWTDGERLHRADILAGRAPEAGARLIFREDILVIVQGDVATFRSRVVRVGTAAGPDRADTSAELVSLRRERGAWRLVSSLSTPLDPTR